MSDDVSQEPAESDIRRRAAWLLGMLALVAVLFVALIVTFFNGSDPKKNPIAGPGTDAPTSTGASSASPQPRRSTTGRATRSTPAPSTTVHHGPASCPTAAPCALSDDIGNAVAAINDYRQKNGQPPVKGAVSKAAQACALSNGSNCSGGWAESQVPSSDGPTAVNKILQFGKLLDPTMKSIGVGWAFSPAGKQYYFAIVRNG